MKKQVLISLGLMTAIVLVLGFVKFMQISAAIAAGESREQPPEAVTSIVVSKQVWPRTQHAVGTISAVSGAMLSAEEMGRVAEVNFESGTTVKAGQVLVSLDSAVEEAQLQAAKARLDLAKIEAKRQTALRERKANAQGDLDRAEATLSEAKAEVNRLDAEVRRRKIIAPFDGVTGVRRVNVGEMVNAGTEVVSLQSFNPLHVDFAIPQRSMNLLTVGLKISLRVDSFPDSTFTGSITAIDASIDTATRNIKVQGTLQNEEERMRPGMFADVTVVYPEQREFITIPISSVSYAPYGDTVYVIEKDENGPRPIRPQIVRLGEKRGDQVAVLSGLNEGEEVATSGVFRLRPNAKVIVNNEVTPGNDPAPTPANT
jgi:membrane fusion protein (multidrug efflux system)